MSKNITIVGGHGNVSLRLARLLGPTNAVKSIIRTPEHGADIRAAYAEPVILSLEDSPVGDFSAVFEGQDIVYFSAGAGSATDRTEKVDYEGALKVFDAIEAVKGPKPRLILVSCIDIRNPEKVPAHYTEADIVASKRLWERIPVYMHWKYEADKNLVKRDAFKWTILRPGGLTHNPGTGKASVGRTRVDMISRDDVAKALALLADRQDAAGLAIDIIGGETPIEEGLDVMIKKGETDFLG